MPTPFCGQEFIFTQPDGTTFTVKGWGNQYQAHFETPDGYTVTQDPATGSYQFARVSDDGNDLIPTGAMPHHVQPSALGLRPGIRISSEASRIKALEGPGMPRGLSRWEQRRKEYREALKIRALSAGATPAPPMRHTIGEYRGLCLLIQFPDVPGTISREEVEAYCNAPGYSGFNNMGSVYDYFHEASGGKLKYTNVVTPYYTAKYPRSYYTNRAVPHGVRARELVKEALEHFRGAGFDFSRLSVDDQGYVYATNVLYAGRRANNWSEGLWPHSYHLQTKFPLVAGKAAFDYQISDMPFELSLATFCHENGHLLCDFPDLYDYGMESSGVGAFCLMCAGGSICEKNPVEICAYLKYRAGWAKSVSQVGPGKKERIAAGENEFFIHRKDEYEYFIIENRLKEGRDMPLPDSGLAIWHVDEQGNNELQDMTPQRHYECSLEQADGRCDLERDRYNYGDATDLFEAGSNDHFGDATNPCSKWWDGSPSGLEIRNISAAGPVMTFST